MRKEAVRLRRRLLSTGNTSLYLDIYVNGRREYEYLKLYLVPEKTKADKDINLETIRLAEAIKAQRTIEIQNNRYGFQSGQKNISFFDYVKYLIAEYDEKGKDSIRGAYTHCLKHMMNFEDNNGITFDAITTEWVRGFRYYLDNTASCFSMSRKTAKLSDNTKKLYFAVLGSILNRALSDGIIRDNPMRVIKKFKNKECERTYLTIEEVKLLADTECKSDVVKRAFLFSCLTGLRWSDIVKLQWCDVSHQGKYTRIIFKQKKTGGQEYIDISPQAAALLCERGEADENVFVGFTCYSSVLSTIDNWVKAAGIIKHVTFHSARHSFAVMMLDIGTDIYTVSKLLGHRELSTTQIYAKVLDKNKQAAVDNIPTIFVKSRK